MSASQVQSTISRVINKTKRRRKGKDSASNSIISNDSEDSGDRRGLRDSVESAIERIKPKKADDDRPLRDTRLSSLIPGLKKSDAQIEDYQRSMDQQDERGRSVSTKRALENELPASNRVDVDKDRPQVIRGLSKSSLITVDDVESLDKPPLTSHPSHAGYLTLSSPHISVTEADQTHSQPVETSAVPPIAISPVDEPTPIAAIPAESDNLAPSSRKKRTVRSRSPAGRFKEVFKTGSSKKSASPTSSPDRDSLGGGRGVVGGLFGGRKGSTSASRGGSKVLDSTPPLPKVPDSDKPLSRPSTARDRLINQPILTNPPSSPTTPTTFVTPPTPILDTGSEFSTPPDSPGLQARSIPASDTPSVDHNSNIVTSPSGHMISHRRVRSSPSNQTQTQTPSKLSNTSFAPLSPTIEESKSVVATPGGQVPSGSGGFFSSVFSAAQNAATTFQNSIANNPLAPGSRSRSGTQSEPNQEEPESEEVISSFPSLPDSIGDPDNGTPSKRPAVETLGLGDLSLSHLGISDPSSAESEKDMSSKPVGGSSGLVTDSNSTARDGRPTTPRRVETASIAESFADDSNVNSKPRSTYEQSLIGDQTPPRTETFEVDTGIRRSGSVRSRVGAVARRKRGSSVTTGGTIAAAIGATNAALGHHSSQNSAPRLTGFAVASKKRNRDFHQLFRSVPEDDYLIEDYSAALQREILLHGRLYVSEGHICFNANIFGWVTTLVISFDEIVSLEKKSTAMVFPNAIVISTLHARNVFASFVSRDSTYDLLVGIWKISHPNLKSSANGISLDDSRGADKTVKVEESESSEGSGDDDEGDDDDEIYDEDEDGEDGSRSLMTAGDGSHIGSDAGDNAQNGNRKPSAIPAGTTVVPGAPANGDAKGSAGSPNAAPAGDFPGPPTHAPTSCSDSATHYDKVIKDETIPAPLGKVYSMVFGPKSGAFMSRWLTEDQKVLELQMEDDKKGLSDEIKTRSFSYIKPLNASIGPKQTKCLITETVEAFDLEKAVSITVTTQTPDVPSGNVFSTKTKYCLTWAEGNSTRLLMNCTIEWTGKSWLKGPIEKGANDGQVTYAKDLVEVLRAGVSSRSRSGTNGTKGKTKGRRRKGNSDSATRPESTRDGANSSGTSSKKAGSTWGPLEPLHSILEPILDIFQPLISGNFALGIVVVLVLVIWFSSSRTRTSAASDETRSMTSLAPAERLVAYEEMWKREESELWNWLEERTGLEGGAFLNKEEQHSKPSGSSKSSKGKPTSSGDKMTQREIDNAIKVTEERLRSLKLMIERGKVDATANTKPKTPDARPEQDL